MTAPTAASQAQPPDAAVVFSAGITVPFSRLHAGLLALWFAVSFGTVFWARDLYQATDHGAMAYWLSAQGAVLAFIALVAYFAHRVGVQAGDDVPASSQAWFVAYQRRLNGRFATFVVLFLAFVLLFAALESGGLRRIWIGAAFLFATVFSYALIGIYSRTSKASDYYVAGRRIPGVYNGMAVAADWMSAASFISMAGGLYLQGYSGSGSQPGGLVYVLGWTGGFVLMGLLVAPYLRRLNLYTLPDYFGLRYGGRWPRIIAAWAAVLCSFTYVVAQIYGVGLITSRLTGVQFEIGILLGLGGVLVCSFLGGMRAVTWTQVTQYVVMIVAFLIPVSWLAYKQLGNPLAMVSYTQQLPKIAELERKLQDSPAEREVIDEYARRVNAYALKLSNVADSLEADLQTQKAVIRHLVETHADEAEILAARRALAAMPRDETGARELWTRAMNENIDRAAPLAGMPVHAQPFAGDPQGSDAQRHTFEVSRRNFLALMFCLMLGTAALPHVVTRFYTTASVNETRRSVAWSLVFIALLYLSAPALAVLVKYEVMAHLVGQRFDALPVWIMQWSRLDPGLIAVADVNHDGLLQFSEIHLSADLVLLATPELAGLPYVISGLVAAGGLAAALSTADGLLLTIGSALAHDLFFEGDTDRVAAVRRVMVSKFALMLVALIAAWVAAQRPADILSLVSASFSLAAAAFAPAMILGIFWAKASRAGAVAGMLGGLGVTVFYMLINQPALRAAWGLHGSGLWWDIEAVSAGVFGVGVGLALTVLVSLLTRQGRALPQVAQMAASK